MRCWSSISYSMLEKKTVSANSAGQFLKFIALIQALITGLVLVQTLSQICELGCSQYLLRKTLLLHNKL